MVVCACPMSWCNRGGVLQGKGNFLPHLRVDVFVHHRGQSTAHRVPLSAEGVTASSVEAAPKSTKGCWSRVISRIVTVEFVHAVLALLVLALVAGRSRKSVWSRLWMMRHVVSSCGVCPTSMTTVQSRKSRATELLFSCR